jgi:hypothetical protein
MCCGALAKNNTKSMTEKNGGTARQVCNCLLSVGGWVIISQGQKKKIYFLPLLLIRLLQRM